ncbi:S-layer homology domain-containing protein [Megasphaera elsdenii]|uniref:S-layer homology domain-containing protein n=1 Tax=Megasphaera TaxID=906 RepID=UPI0008F3C637|nr:MULTISPECIES: S-layer homology domain-containing protein [Megasphaera]MCI7049424.1 S-layer homology domain-containing protein [Megasphaera elsdenii]MCQ4112469.1 S-layer homology domain-containing protein [Megasphaera sp. SC8-1]MCQ4113270.1 S-layer homology domain-containing protein [Megasphaera sp. SC8-1]SFI18990.1 S-layer homology domain-containing protein [Megasphaera elsdenii]
MKTKVLAALAATMAVGATCAFAANPFVDVPSDSWAYKSVVELADAGIIQGVDGQYFQGNRNITRYEAAEMVAKAMAHMDKASVEQRALINKLADEYADELNNLGVRVSALENRVGNVKLTGDARVRYIHQDSDDQGKGEVKNDNSWSYRVRVRANAQVNDRTKVVYGVSTNNVNFADNSTASDSKDNNIFTDRAFVDYNFGGNNWDLKVGRDEYDMGGGRAYGFLYGDTFDGAQLKYTNDKFAATAGYGKFKEGVMGGDNGASAATKTGYGELEGFFGGGRAAGSAVGVYYNDFSGNKSFNFDDAWGAYGSLNLGKWNALANYEKYNSENSKADDPEVWVGKITYNKANFATPKSWDAWVEYLNADNGFGDKTHAFIGSTQSWRNGNLLNNVKSWGVGADYTFAKNAQFQVMQSFASEAKEGNNDPGEETRAQFVFVF